MTRHDPFSYGQVQLGGGKAPAGGDPDDILFSESSALRPAPGPDSSWGLLDQDVDSLLPGAQGTNPLDFAPPARREPPPAAVASAAPARAATPTMRARPAATPRPAMAAADSGSVRSAASVPHQVGVRQPAPQAHVEQAALLGGGAPAVPAPVAARPVRAKAGPPYIGRRRSRAAGMFAFLLVFAGGGSVAGWLYGMQHNVIMAALVGLLTLVAAMFTAVLTRG